MEKSDNPERETRILQAAAQLFAHYGFDKTTVSDIAREAGVSKGAIYLHFASKEELLERFLPSLKRFNPDFDRSWVKDTWLWKTAYAQPVPPVNHSKNIPPIRTPVPGLYFASMSQVYPWDRGTNYAVEIGQKAAAQLMEDFGA